ncbi:MAG: TspO/MBR family protein [Verrucomicrobiota bacterium]
MPFWKKAVICIVTIEVLGNASGLVTLFSLEGWYDSLKKPPGTPPTGTFGPVWLIIYAMMGLSLALLLSKEAQRSLKRRALTWFVVQFCLNLSWTPAFFGLQRIDLALVIIIPMLLAILMTIRSSWPVSKTAALLLLPYLLWVGYATYLNAGFLVLNPPG